MDTLEYMRIKALLVPEEIIQQYKITDKIHNGILYMEIRKCMYGFPKHVSLTTPNSNNTYPPLATNRANTHQVYGSMKVELINYV